MATPSPTPSAQSKERLLQVIGQQVVRIIELEDEIRRRDALEQKKAGSSPSESHRHDALDEVNLDDLVALRHAYLKLRTEHAECAQIIERWTAKYANAKQCALQWAAWWKYWSRKRSASPRLPEKLTSSANKKTEDRTEEPLLRTTSSQSTIVETQNLEAATTEDDFIPEVVSERPVKRRRRNTPPRIKQEPGTAETPLMIASDDQDALPVKPRLSPQASDLDATPVQEKPQPARIALAEVSSNRIMGQKLGTPRALNFKKPASTIAKHTPPSVARILRPGPKTKPSPHLRFQPLDKLELSDFVPNVLYTGPTISYTSPAQADPGRRCLPGCTRPACCGNKYRQMLEIVGPQASGKTDEEALELYLGPNYANMIATYDDNKIADLTMQAHAMAFAQQSGATSKFARARTPPGYWRVGMPNTQEIDDENRQAYEEERRRVAERYHEAMRHNGSWTFRDES